MTHITPCSGSEVQWSSVEHSGLGMYGDEINPWGDRQAVAQLWCRGRAKAWFFFGPGPEGPGGSVMGRKLHNENRCLVQCLGRWETFSQVFLGWKCNLSHTTRELIKAAMTQAGRPFCRSCPFVSKQTKLLVTSPFCSRIRRSRVEKQQPNMVKNTLD